MIRSVDTLSKIFLPDNFPMGPRGQLTLPLLGTTLLAKCDASFKSMKHGLRGTMLKVRFPGHQCFRRSDRVSLRKIPI